MSNMKQALSKVKDKIQTIGLPSNPSKWEEDGKDHINLMADGKTHLGKSLSIRGGRTFEHPVLGQFRSLDNLWYFMRAALPDDTLRGTLNHEQLRRYVRENGGELRNVKHFRAAFMHSAYLRILASPSLMDDFVESTLPFDCYRKAPMSIIAQRLSHSVWFAEGYEMIRKAMKAHEDPDFSKLMDGHKPNEKEIYSDVFRNITGRDSVDPIDLSDWIAAQWIKHDRRMEDKAAIQKAKEEAQERAKAKKKPKKKKKPRLEGGVAEAVRNEPHLGGDVQVGVAETFVRDGVMYQLSEEGVISSEDGAEPVGCRQEPDSVESVEVLANVPVFASVTRSETGGLIAELDEQSIESPVMAPGVFVEEHEVPCGQCGNCDCEHEEKAMAEAIEKVFGDSGDK